MGTRAGDCAVLFAPPVAVGSAVGIVLVVDEPAAFLPLLLVLQPLTVLGLVVGLVQLTRTDRGPATFQLIVYRGEPAFAALPRFRRQCIFNGLLSAALLLMALNGLRVPGRVVPTLAAAILVLNGLAMVLQVYRMVSAGALVLVPAGIAIDGGRSFVPWAALGPGPDRAQWTLAHPELVEGRSLRRFQPGQDTPLDVSLWFLFRAIHLYVEQPERRPAIGTAAELDRIRGVLTRQSA
jgi:hypothetical protein